MRILAVVCHSGLGHYGRTLALLARLAARQPVSVTLVCESWQVERMPLPFPADVVTGVVEPGVHGPVNADLYRDGRLLAWEERLARVPALWHADVVVSDNLCGVLSVRPDAILVGSFLWSDVLGEAYPSHADVQRFVLRERELLARHSPPMLCVGDVAMPGVLQRTRAVPLPWMCEAVSRTPAARSVPRIALLGGATGVADEILVQAARALSDGPWELCLPPSLLERASPRGRAPCLPFGYGPQDFSALSAVVCRPGMGTVTDCVSYHLPMVTLHEANSPEMEHLAGRLEALGVAKNLGAAPAGESVVLAIHDLLGRAARMRSRLAELKTDGLDRAVDWLVETAQGRGADRNVRGDPWEAKS